MKQISASPQKKKEYLALTAPRQQLVIDYLAQWNEIAIASMLDRKKIEVLRANNYTEEEIKSIVHTAIVIAASDYNPSHLSNTMFATWASNRIRGELSKEISEIMRKSRCTSRPNWDEIVESIESKSVSENDNHLSIKENREYILNLINQAIEYRAKKIVSRAGRRRFLIAYTRRKEIFLRVKSGKISAKEMGKKVGIGTAFVKKLCSDMSALVRWYLKETSVDQ